MIESTHDVVLALARLRQRGCLPAAGVPVGDVERAADLAGRRVELIDGREGGPLMVLGWQGAEPPASPQAPKLSRRTLSPTETRTMVVVYALLHDPRTNRVVITNEQVLTTVGLLTGRTGNSWVLPALQETFPRAGLTVVADGGWRAGPIMHVWDGPTRDVMAHAARGLWQHPMWPQVPNA